MCSQPDREPGSLSLRQITQSSPTTLQLPKTRSSRCDPSRPFLEGTTRYFSSLGFSLGEGSFQILSSNTPCHTEKEYNHSSSPNSHHYRGPRDLSPGVFIHSQMQYQADRDALRLNLRSRWFILSARPQDFPIGCLATSAAPPNK